ncbi:glucosyltransferase domain-containing protein [Commensalibacter nepenthis]|uniref:Glucosyltransferase domain-containing protein n=1 Tax=Commensalibacter nepenthis TaxID=3043872 RepID=A0ABT6Q8Z1_9PROT|nr:glucosyltransferase domain-containing protein [Commensalibacter sp. TBRC 10068]MDI2113382.1 glucosyltransferase domain-containing protein [Commensalibacter sp. TBRC 10068]
MTDDYAMLDIAIGHSGSLLEWDVENGRSIYGLFQYLVQSHMVNVPRLSWLRLFSVITTIILCSFTYFFLSRRVQVTNKNFVLFLPLFLVFLPSIVVYNSWATCFVFVLSVLLAGLAYYNMFDENKNTTISRFLISNVFLICSFFIYQPTAMLFLYFVFLHNCIDNRKLNLLNLVLSAIALMIAMIAAFLSIKVVPKLLYGYVIDRSNLNTDFISKVKWFFYGPLKIAVNNYNITPSLIYTIISIIFIFCGLVYIFKERQGFLKILLTLLLTIGIMVPALLAKESWIATRSSVGLYFIIITIILFGLVNIYNQYLPKFNIKIILGCMLFMIGIYTQHYIYSGFIRQQQAEYQALTQEIMSILPARYSGLIRFDISNPVESAFTKINLFDEIGHTSIQTSWALRGIARSIKQLKGLSYQIDNSSLVLESADKCKNNCIIIHCADLLRKAKNYK